MRLMASVALWLSVGAHADDGAFRTLPDLSFARYEAAAGLLADGTVLLYGPSYDADVFDPGVSSFAQAGTIPDARFGAALVPLPNGGALVLGGSAVDPRGVRYDAATHAWSWGPSLAVPRAHAQVATLADGRVLIAGGVGQDGVPLASAELFDPRTDTFVPTGDMPSPREGGIAQRLQDGRVLVAAGVDATGYGALCAAVYDPGSGVFAPAACFYIAAQGHYLPASVVLRDGRVMLSGGVLFTGPSTQQASTDAEVYDPATNAWSSSWASARVEHTLSLLADGTVLVVGGKDAWGYPLADTEFYDPRSGAFRAGPALALGRAGHSASVLPGNRVLVAGGVVSGGGWTATAELYTADALFADSFERP